MPRPLLVGLIGVGVVLALTWLVWTALLHSRPAVAAQVLTFRIDSDTSVSATISVERRDPSVPVTCRVLAQAADFQPVGEEQVSIAASSDHLVDVSLDAHDAATCHRRSGQRVHCELKWFGLPLIALGDV